MRTILLPLFAALACSALAQAPRLVVPTGHSDDITAAAISPDEKYVLTGSADETAILWSIGGDEMYTFKRHSGSIKAVAFLYDGNDKFVLTADDNGHVNQWDLSGNHKRDFSHSPPYQHGRNWVEGIVFSPDGKTVCIKAHNYFRCTDILHPKEGDRFDNDPVPPFFENAPEGVSSKNFTLRLEGRTATLWSKDGKKNRTFMGHSVEIRSAAFSPEDGGNTILTLGGDGLGRLWDATKGSVAKILNQTPPWLNAATLSPPSPDDPAGGKFYLTGGKDVTLWSRANPQEPVRTFREANNNGFDLGQLFGPSYIAIFSSDGKSVLATDRESVVRWDVNSGEEIDVFRGHHERVNAIAVTRAANGGMYVLAGSNDNTAKLWDPANNVVKEEEMSARQMGDPIGSEFVGGEIQTYSGHANDVISVAFSPATSNDPVGGKYVLTGSRDNTAKIWDRATGKEIATLIVLDSTEWAVTTPTGLFDASPGAMNLMHFVVGTEIVDLEQLKERYYEPGLLGKLVGSNRDPLRAVESFNAVPLYPEMSAQVSDDKLKLQVSLTPRAGGIGKLSVFVNGKEVVEDANPGRVTALNIDLTEFAQYYLPGEPNQLALRVYNQAGWLKSPALELGYQPPAAARGSGTAAPVAPASPAKGKPALYAVVVGTADYAGDKLDLKFADRDASLFSQALRAAAPRVFGQQVFVTLLSTDAKETARQDVSSKATIKKAFADIAAKAKAQDVLVIYFSGHGVNYGTAEQGQFYYLTKDIASENLTDPEIRNNYTISSTELTGWIKAIPALKQVMILDACNSGKIVEDLAGRKDLSSSQVRALDRMKDRTGMFILTGSAADKVSFEASQYGQGLLTYSLLQGMSGLALTDDKRVDVMTLFQFSRDKVPELAKGIGGIQTPILAFPVSGASFDIGVVDPQVKIPLAQVKPVFIRNNFQDEDSFDDVLGLTPALASYFQQITLQGAQASLIYVDVAEYENAYSMKGRYKQNGDAVEVRGKLFKGKTAKGEFQVTGKKSDLPGLVEAIVEKVSGMVE